MAGEHVKIAGPGTVGSLGEGHLTTCASDQQREKKKKKKQLQLFTATPPPKPENVLHYTSVLGICCETCSRCLMMSVRAAGQQGVAVLLRLTSTRLFLAEDLLTAHLTL